MSDANIKNDRQRLDWLDDNENVFEFISALTVGLPPAIERQIKNRKLDPSNLQIRDLIDMLMT